jgi:hypothetical protein
MYCRYLPISLKGIEHSVYEMDTRLTQTNHVSFNKMKEIKHKKLQSFTLKLKLLLFVSDTKSLLNHA